MARYKYSENTKEVTDIYFDTETHGEFMGMEQGGEMRKVTTARIKEKLIGEIVLGVDWQQEVLTMTSTPPASPVEGDRYIVGTSATGSWEGRDDYIAEYTNGAWAFLAPQSRMGVFSYNDMYFLIYLEGEWKLLATLDEITELRDEVQGYRDEILNDPNFQAVSADLRGDDNIGVVADALAIITAVNNNSTNINTVASNNSNVTAVGTSISAVNAVATDLGLGASSLIKIVADNIAYVTTVANNITKVNTVAGLNTEITALGARTTEIDALYAQLPAIAEKESIANVDALKGTGWAGETVKGNATAIALNTPPGIIVMWSGLISAIPTGWFLCNGSNGTPDLRGRFIYGASIDADVKTTGGSADAIVVSHTHTGPAHTHTSAAHTHSTPNHTHSASSNSTGAHTHTIGKHGWSAPGTGFQYNDKSGNAGVANTGSAGAHSHTITVNSGGASTTGSTTPGATGSSGTGNTGSTGSSGTNANLPPYMKLAYIMKG